MHQNNIKVFLASQHRTDVCHLVTRSSMATAVIRECVKPHSNTVDLEMVNGPVKMIEPSCHDIFVRPVHTGVFINFQSVSVACRHQRPEKTTSCVTGHRLSAATRHSAAEASQAWRLCGPSNDGIFILAAAQGIAGTRAQRTTLRWN